MLRMSTAVPRISPTSASPALRWARRAWKLLHIDSALALKLAERALERAMQDGDTGAEGWARLARGIHLLYFARPKVAAEELRSAQRLFEQLGDVDGHLLARAGLARGLWRQGRYDEALQLALSLRDTGLSVLRHDQRGFLLNTIAGCYSARNQSEQAFAYLYQALRDAPPARGHGYDAVLHCNLAHELLQLGHYHEALKHVHAGLSRFDVTKNPRLASVLWINRVIVLTELDRADEALPDIERVCALPADASGRGALTPHFETMATAALAAGDLVLGRELVQRALAAERESIVEEQVELAIAQALLARAEGDLPGAAALLDDVREPAAVEASAVSLRVRCALHQVHSQVLEALGDAAGALGALREWQHLAHQRAEMASRAHYQAAALHTELLLMRHKLDEQDAQRRATERSRDALTAINHQLAQKVAEVQALQAALRQQAIRDELTGLFNRRHLNATLPSMWALAQREGRQLAVAIIDLDHFKRVNDERGHDAGDRLLAAFGHLLAASLRKSDVACRYGGEEFCVLMQGTDAAGAKRKVAALLKRWRVEAVLQGAVGEAGSSFSAGVADSRTSGADSPQALLACADQELLAAKREGRNRVRTCPAA
jgi:diguanylate cyclase (GGDEF)-like protein